MTWSRLVLEPERTAWTRTREPPRNDERRGLSGTRVGQWRHRIELEIKFYLFSFVHIENKVLLHLSTVLAC